MNKLFQSMLLGALSVAPMALNAQDATISITTEMAPGETIKMAINCPEEDKPNVWVDLNDNGQRDDNEEVSNWSESMVQIGLYTVDNPQITVHGPVTYFGVLNGKVNHVDVSKAPQLEFLGLPMNETLSEKIDFSQNPKLNKLMINQTSIEELDLSLNPELLELIASSSKLKTIDVSANTKLIRFDIQDTPITSVDLSRQAALQIVNISKSNVSSIDLSGCPELQQLYATDCGLKELDLSKSTKLEILDLTRNKLTALDLSQNKNIESLTLTDNTLETIDISTLDKLSLFLCENNLLKEIQFAPNAPLMVAYLSNNQLKKIELPESDTAILGLKVDNNQIESIKLPVYGKGMLIQLAELWLHNNKITQDKMDQLIETMPDITTQYPGILLPFMLVDLSSDTEQNSATESQVARLKQKGWEPYNFNGDQANMQPYTSISEVVTAVQPTFAYDPALATVTLSISEELLGATIELFDTTGTRLMSTVADALELTLAVDQLPVGVYLIAVDGGAIYRFVK